VQVCHSNPSHLSTHLLFQLYIQSSTLSGRVSLSKFEITEKLKNYCSTPYRTKPGREVGRSRPVRTNASDLSVMTPRHTMKYPVIADTGANYHMFKEREFFVDMLSASGNVLLGDGKTIILIQGVGTVQCFINDHLVTLHDVRYIPALGESIYSLFIHIKTAGHGLESSYDDGPFLHSKPRLLLGPQIFIWISNQSLLINNPVIQLHRICRMISFYHLRIYLLI
jgi:hypothetical protein